VVNNLPARMRKLTLRDLEDLGWQRFEDLVAAIVLKTYPGAEQLGGKDGGADVLLERHDGLVRVWQAKHFAGDIRWQHCEKSLDDAVASYAPDQVIFVFPRNMGKEVKDTFARRLKARHPEVDISYMSGSQILAKLRQLSEEHEREEDTLVYEFFGPDPRDQARAFADRLATHGLRLSRDPGGDELRHHLELADEAGRRDRNFRTEVTLSTGRTPLAEWSEEPALLLTTTESDRQLQIAVWPERDETILDLVFEDGEEGERARWQVARQLSIEGKAKMPKGAEARLTKVPEALKAISPTPDVLRDGTLTSVGSLPVKLAGKRGRRRIERTLEVVAVPPLEPTEEGARNATFGRMDGELSLFLDISVKGDRGKIGIGLSFHLIGGEPDLDSVVEALQLLVSVDEGNGRLEIPGFPEPIALRAAPRDSEQVERNRSFLQFFESLVRIRDELGVDGFDLGDEVTEDQNEQTVLTARIIEHGAGGYVFERFGVEVPEKEILQLERIGYDRAVARFPVAIELFGQELDLGIAESELPEPSEVKVLDAEQDGKRRLELSWSEPSRVLMRLIGERGADAPETGLWARGRAPKVRRGGDAGSGEGGVPSSRAR
jgi:hypothetical protein